MAPAKDATCRRAQIEKCTRVQLMTCAEGHESRSVPVFAIGSRRGKGPHCFSMEGAIALSVTHV